MRDVILISAFLIGSQPTPAVCCALVTREGVCISCLKVVNVTKNFLDEYSMTYLENTKDTQWANVLRSYNSQIL